MTDPAKTPYLQQQQKNIMNTVHSPLPLQALLEIVYSPSGCFHRTISWLLYA